MFACTFGCSQKELVTYHNPDTYPMGSFELIASNRIRSDEETLGEIFNGRFPGAGALGTLSAVLVA